MSASETSHLLETDTLLFRVQHRPHKWCKVRKVKAINQPIHGAGPGLPAVGPPPGAKAMTHGIRGKDCLQGLAAAPRAKPKTAGVFFEAKLPKFPGTISA